MDMKLHWSYLISLSLILSACHGLAVTTQTAVLLPSPTSTATIDEVEAIQLAVQYATTDNLHFTGTSEKPANLHAELISLSCATKKLQSENYAFGYDATTYHESLKVWLVTMNGSWPREFPPLQLGEPTREPYEMLGIIIESNTGVLITIAAK
jgi:hypothetical protein